MQIFDTEETARLLNGFLGELQTRYGEGSSKDEWAVVGIHRRGDILARRLVDRIVAAGEAAPPLGVLDITLYRDDFSPGRPQPMVRPSDIDFDVNGRRILLVDDVFQTGRTIRAALNQLADFGRPTQVVLAVFIDREQRELPICPDHVGVTVEQRPDERVHLHLAEVDGCDEVVRIAEPTS
ncbi:MAG: bifunctional pyr operon transcriptional regulator/uracil phosphoribosyltransferase PyrR [Planctomycetota bacterium]